jgi:cysteinyl-tRNA synthetase
LNYRSSDKIVKKELTKEVQDLIKERKIARENKDYKESDRIRDILLRLGVKINDT